MIIITKAFLISIIILYCFYCVPYLIRLGWGQAENKTKKVCDLCFRDIKLINDRLNKINDEEQKVSRLR